MGSIPGQGTEIPHAVGQLSPCATTTELARLNESARAPWSPRATLERKNPHAIRKSPRAAMKDPTRLDEDPVCCN